MKKFSKWLTLCLMLMAGVAIAQDEGHQKIEAAKIALITNRLNLTPEQAARFWPLYNEYNGKKRELHRKQRQIHGQTGGDARSKLDEIQSINRSITNLDGEYRGRFQGVITEKQLLELYEAEQTFNKMLIDRLR